MKRGLRIVPWMVLAVFAAEVLVALRPRRDGEWWLHEFGRLPVLLNGRVQPLDSVGRNSLLQIRSTGEVPLAEVPRWQLWRHPPKLRATEWLAEVLFRPDLADSRPIFLIHHPELLTALNLHERGVERSGLRYYTYRELEPVLPTVFEQARQAARLKDPQRTPYQKQVLKLANAVTLYEQLKNSVQPETTRDLFGLLQEYRAALPAGVAAAQAGMAGRPTDPEALRKLTELARPFDRVARMARPMVIPPANPADKEAWRNLGEAALEALQTGTIHPAVELYARMASGYVAGDAGRFNRAVQEYRTWLAEQFPQEHAKGRAEHYFNQVKFFLRATIVYIAAFVLAVGALVTWGVAPGWSEAFRRSASYLVVLALVVHSAGLLFRMMLEGRPPVTNLYSSAVFIGWGTCVFGIFLERAYRVGLGSAVAGLAGFVTLLIAHNLALGGDTMEMLRAVLDTNFWLATHVVVITLGYAATFVAGGLGLAYVALGVFTRLLRQPVGQEGRLSLGDALTKMVYGVVCFATLFSFAGTVLGGIWADQSWGRFWGWDPKENGALMIVLWNALILHARWGGLVRARGLMNLVIFGNVVTAFSWFGTNMLGIGLHSYGFMDAAFHWLMAFNASQLMFIGLGLLPLRWWRSFRPAPTSRVTPAEPVRAELTPSG